MRIVRPLARPARAALLATLVALGSTAALTGTASAARATTPKLRCSAPGTPPITVVLVHGAWAQPSSWNGEVARLQAAGCSVHAIANPVQDLTTDAQSVADYVSTVPGPVLLVGHSYGGSVITNAAAEVKNVVGLVYVDAAAPAPGETTASLSGARSKLSTEPMSSLFTTFTYPGAPAGAMDMLLTRHAFTDYFAQDLPRAEAVELYDEQTPASTAALMAPSQYAAWQTLPSWYFISTGDQIITPAAELSMAHRAHSHITIFHGGSHLTLVSHPAAVTATIGTALHSLLAH